jgi:hypothetical protein
MKFARQADAKFRQSERSRNTLVHKLPEVLAGAALDNFRDYPEARGRMVFVLAADGPFEPPFRESFQALALVEPLILRTGRVWKSAKSPGAGIPYGQLLVVATRIPASMQGDR